MSTRIIRHTDEVPVRIYADWQIFGDVDPKVYMTEILETARTAGLIESHEIVIADNKGPFGLCYVYFTVDAAFTAKALTALEETAKELLIDILREEDVEVRWVVHHPRA